ncbi:MAG: HD domain-containing protein [Planctomycetaceae bacterium]
MNEKLRRQILFEAAHLLQTKREKDPHRARIRAARKISRGWIHPADLPDAREITGFVTQLELGESPSDYAGGIWQEIDPCEDSRFEAFAKLLAPLELVGQNRRNHPEGDLLYHCLQVFELVCDECPYDEEVLLAGLLHDVGRPLDPKNHVESALAALSGLISERTAWLIEHHMLGRGLLDGTIGVRARRRLAANEDFEWLELLARADLDGRIPGMRVRELEEVLSYVRNLGSEFAS